MKCNPLNSTLHPVSDEQVKFFDVDGVVVIVVGLAFELFDNRRQIRDVRQNRKSSLSPVSAQNIASTDLTHDQFIITHPEVSA